MILYFVDREHIQNENVLSCGFLPAKSLYHRFDLLEHNLNCLVKLKIKKVFLNINEFSKINMNKSVKSLHSLMIKIVLQYNPDKALIPFQLIFFFSQF